MSPTHLGRTHAKEWLAWQYDALFERRVLARADHVIAISPYVRRAFASYERIRWHDIDNPVEDDWFAVERQPLPGRLLCPARLIPRKGTDVLIRAFAAIATQQPDAQLRLAGETESMPDYVRDCVALAAANGIGERVHFLGNLDRAGLRAEFAQCQAVVLPARQETAPMAVAEAMAAGCPVIASVVGGLPDMIIPETTGLLIPPDDVAALAEALTRTLSDSGQSADWGRQGRQIAATRFGLDGVVRKTLDVYAEVLSATE